MCQWLTTGPWFSLGPPVTSTNINDHHDRTEILLKVALNTMNHHLKWSFIFIYLTHDLCLALCKSKIRLFYFYFFSFLLFCIYLFIYFRMNRKHDRELGIFYKEVTVYRIYLTLIYTIPHTCNNLYIIFL